MANINHNDEVIAFLVANGYPSEYNDGLLQWLRAFFGVSSFTLNDLLHRYQPVYGNELLPAFLLRTEASDDIITEDGTFLTQEYA